MKKTILSILAAVSWILSAGQSGSLSLEQCYLMAMKNHPLSAQNALFDKSSQVQSDIYDKTNLPQLNVNGQATYQSAVTELPIKIPGMSVPEMPKDQYKVTLDATQVLYGGGIVKQQKILEQDNLMINRQGTESELYRLKEKINQVYFSILLCNNTLDILKVNREEVESRQRKIDAGVKNGAVLPFNSSIMSAELLKVDQKLIETNAQKNTLISMLSVLTGSTIESGTRFEAPGVNTNAFSYSNIRPEYKLFDLQEKKAASLKDLTLAKKNPRLIAFGNFGYGRPGLNMLKEDAELFYIVGAKVSWNLWNWQQTRREMQMIDISRDIIENQKKTYDLNIKASVQQYLGEITKINELLKTDDEIISLRKDITRSAASQLENGVITATEYLTEYNAEVQARLSKSLHEIQLIQAWSSYQAATGNL